MKATEDMAPGDLAIRVDEATAEDCTRRIADRVTVVLQEFYGDVGQAMIEHAVCEAFAQVSFQLRSGNPVALEALGVLWPREAGGRVAVDFYPCPTLAMPPPDGAIDWPAVKLAALEVAHG